MHFRRRQSSGRQVSWHNPMLIYRGTISCCDSSTTIQQILNYITSLSNSCKQLLTYFIPSREWVAVCIIIHNQLLNRQQCNNHNLTLQNKLTRAQLLARVSRRVCYYYYNSNHKQLITTNLTSLYCKQMGVSINIHISVFFSCY